MRILFRKKFTKQFQKLRSGEKKRLKERIRLFKEDDRHPILEDHALVGLFSGRRSINIGGDLRALYRMVDKETVQFVAIGTHSELYE